MVADAILQSQVEQFADAGADLISVHAENADADAALELIAARGLKSGIVLQLHSPVSAAAPFLDRISMLTLLGTRIGVKGQDLDAEAEPRLREARALIAAEGAGRRVVLAADGGIREHTVPGLRQAGAETIVMGSLAFGANDLAAAHGVGPRHAAAEAEVCKSASPSASTSAARNCVPRWSIAMARIVSRAALATDVAGGPAGVIEQIRRLSGRDRLGRSPAAHRRRRCVGAWAARQRDRHGHRHPDAGGLGGVPAGRETCRGIRPAGRRRE